MTGEREKGIQTESSMCIKERRNDKLGVLGEEREASWRSYICTSLVYHRRLFHKRGALIPHPKGQDLSLMHSVYGMEMTEIA